MYVRAHVTSVSLPYDECDLVRGCERSDGDKFYLRLPTDKHAFNKKTNKPSTKRQINLDIV